jgi:hypothetical protein
VDRVEPLPTRHDGHHDAETARSPV